MKYFFAALFTSFIAMPLDAQQWPLNPQNNQYPIVGTIGEDRDGGRRFHKGCDIAESAGTLVVSIEDGIVNNKGNSSLCVGTYCYIHVVPLPSIILGDSISSGDTIGTIQFISNQHIHLQKTDSLYNRILNVNVDTIAWANPLNFLSPFVDNFPPNIQELHVFEYQSYGTITGADFYGNIDVVMNVTDPRITANGGNGNANNNQGVAPYSMGYMLLDVTQTDTFFRHENTFEFSPDNTNTNLIFTPNTNVATSDYEYYLNSYFRTPPTRRPFNLRSSIGIGSATTPDSVMIEDGHEMLLKVTACDITGNCDDEIYQHNGNNYTFTLDNFKPYVKSIIATINGTEIYSFKWETVNGELEPRGGIPQNLPNFTAFDLAQGMIVYVEMSEQMHDLNLDLRRNFSSCDIGSSSISSFAFPGTDRKTWRFEFGDLRSCPIGEGVIDPTGAPWRFIFSGHDYGPSGQSGSELLGFHRMYDAVTNGNGNSSLRVPLMYRIATSAPEWSNTGHPDFTEGVDSTHYFRFDCSANNLRGNENEEIEKRNNESLTFSCCRNLEIVLDHQFSSSSDDIICGPLGDCKNVIAISVDGRGVEQIDPIGTEINWSNGDNGKRIQNICSGIYTVTVTTNSGCETIESFQTCCIDVIVSNIEQSGDDDNEGAFSFQINSDVDIQSVMLDGRGIAFNDDGSGFVGGLAEGDYEIVAFVEGGCYSRKIVEIDYCGNFENRERVILNEYSSTIDATIIGNDTYTYNWSDGTIGPVLSQARGSSTNLVSVTNSKGCTKEVEYLFCVPRTAFALSYPSSFPTLPSQQNTGEIILDLSRSTSYVDNGGLAPPNTTVSDVYISEYYSTSVENFPAGMSLPFFQDGSLVVMPEVPFGYISISLAHVVSGVKAIA